MTRLQSSHAVLYFWQICLNPFLPLLPLRNMRLTTLVTNSSKIYHKLINSLYIKGQMYMDKPYQQSFTVSIIVTEETLLSCLSVLNCIHELKGSTFTDLLNRLISPCVCVFLRYGLFRCGVRLPLCFTQIKSDKQNECE